MALLEALSGLPSTSYSHPIANAIPSSSKLNPYLPLPPTSTLFTDPTFLDTLPDPIESSVIHVVGSESVRFPQDGKVLILLSRTSQEAYDHALLALKVAKSGISTYHFIGASALSGNLTPLPNVAEWLESSTPALNGASAEPHQAERLTTAYESAALSLLKASRRAQRPFVTHDVSPKPSRTILNFLPYTPTLQGESIIDVSLASPLPRDKIRHAIKGFSEVVVLESNRGNYGTAWAWIFDALDGLDYEIRSILVGADPDIPAALATLAPISRTGTPPQSATVPNTSIAIPSPESKYIDLLSSSPSPLEILNDPASLSASESTSPLYAFGKAVAIRRERERLVELAKTVLKASGVRPEVHEALGQWLLVRDQPASAAAGEAVEKALGQGSTPDEVTLLQLGRKGHWAKKNLWIVISNSWAQDLASSGLHHALASGLDINLLVYETAPSPFSPLAPPQPSRERKKDLALYALNMGDVYVSSVAVYADFAGVINAMREAEAYSGPSLVLAYLPWGEKEDGQPVGQGEVAGPLERLRETKRAVSGGWWPMFRWNPAAEDGKQFTLDSPAIKTALSQFLDRQSHLSQLTRATPAIDPSITSSKGTDLVAARKAKAKRAYDALLNSLDGPGLLILYASDGGTAEKVSKRLAGRAKMRGVNAVVQVFDGIAKNMAEALGAEKNAVFITAVAGQGESPLNGREFTKALNATTSVGDAWQDLKISTFGMGDSNYWPRKEDYIYFNKPANDLHPKLLALGASELVPIGLGDDQDPDGYLTAYKPWEASLWRALGVDSVEVAEAQEEVVANEHIKIASDYLRGTILEGLEDKTTGAISASDAQLTKFHGTYMQVS